MAVQLHNKYVLGEFELDADKYLLKHHNEPVHLPELPFQVLLYLVEHRERYVNRQELLNRFWAGSDAYEETLTKCISTIRTQLNDPPNSPRFIETRKKVGYRYIGPFSERPLKPQSSSYEIQRTRGVQIIFEEQDDEVDSLRVRDRVIRVNDPNGPSQLSASRHSPVVSPRVIVIALGLGALALVFVVWRTRIFRPAETGVLRTMQIPTPTGLESPALSPDGN